MINIINLASILLLLVFGVAYLLKLFILRKKYKIKANVLANKNKNGKAQRVERMLQATTFSWIIIWFGEIIVTLLSLDNRLMLLNSDFIRISGLVLIAIGVIFFITAAITMKNSWRVGIDKSTKSKLITEGIYKYSRNPAFVGFYLMFIGLFLVYSDLITCISMLINIYAMNRLVIEEEKHLEKMFGKEYTDYKKKAPRYLL
jgi:protein-S-isoprenylcysteine O-methyltransferase Ste14